LGLGDFVDRNSPNLIDSVSNIIKISAGNNHTIALDEKGFIFSFGSNFVIII
jgi:alpha-tubulin suppressor-like RCC1 family protein